MSKNGYISIRQDDVIEKKKHGLFNSEFPSLVLYTFGLSSSFVICKTELVIPIMHIAVTIR